MFSAPVPNQPTVAAIGFVPSTRWPMAHQFTKIPAVPTAQALEDLVLGSQQQVPEKEDASLDEVRAFCIEQIILAHKVCSEKLSTVIDAFPPLDDLHPFYREFVTVLFDKDHMLIAAEKLRTGLTTLNLLRDDYVKIMKFADQNHRCVHLNRVAVDRIGTEVHAMGPSLAYFEQVRQHMGRIPAIDPRARTILLCGYPNVGKSSFMNRITCADVDVQPYAFTTKSLFVGQCQHKFLRFQVVDLPGLLDRPLADRNAIEMQTIIALGYLNAAILFFIDVSEECGYSISQQVQLFHHFTPLFRNKAVIVVLNKTDVKTLDACTFEEQALIRGVQSSGVTIVPCTTTNDESAEALKSAACDSLLERRTAAKVATTIALPRAQVESSAAVPRRRQTVDEIQEVEEVDEVGSQMKSEAVQVDTSCQDAGVNSQEMCTGQGDIDGGWVLVSGADGGDVGERSAGDFVDPEIADALEALEELELELGGLPSGAAADARAEDSTTASSGVAAARRGVEEEEEGATGAGGEVGEAPEGLLGLPMALVGQCWPARRVGLGLRVCQALRRQLPAHTSEALVVRGPGARSAVDAEEVARSLRRLCGREEGGLRVSLACVEAEAGSAEDRAGLPAVIEGAVGAGVGGRLRRLQLKGERLRESTGALGALLEGCPGLEVLDVAGAQLDAGAMQRLQGPLGACARLECVDFGWNRLGVHGVVMLVDALAGCSGLQHLGLGRCRMGAGGFQGVMGAVSGWPRLRVLDLRGNRLDVEGEEGRAAVAKLGGCRALEELRFGQNELSGAGGAWLGEAAGRCEALERLDLSDCMLGYEGMHLDAGLHLRGMVEGLLKCRRLARLDLGGNEIDDAAAAEVARVLQCETLTELRLEGNPLRDAGMTALGGALARWGHRLTYLGVLSVGEVSDGAAQAFSRDLRGCTSLRALRLGGELGFGDTEVAMRGVAETLGGLCGSLRRVDLGACGLGSARLAAVAEGVRQCSGLQELGLASNCIDEADAATVAGTVAALPRLTALDLRGNNLATAGATAVVAAGLRGCAGLTHIDLRRNALSSHSGALVAGLGELPRGLPVLVESDDHAPAPYLSEAMQEPRVGWIRDQHSGFLK